MDPNATLELVAYYLKGGATFAAFDAAVNLRDWLDHGGFKPTNTAEHPGAWEYVESLRGKVDSFYK